MTLDDQILSTTAEMHSAQDGLTAGALLGLVVTQSPLLPIVVVALGFGAQRLSRRELARELPELLRTSQIRSNPEYFVVGAIAGVAIAAAVSLGLDTLGISASSFV